MRTRMATALAVLLTTVSGLAVASPAAADPPVPDYPSQFANFTSGMCLEIDNWNTTDFARATQNDCVRGANQLWRFRWTGALSTAEIVNVNSGKCLEVGYYSTANFAGVNQYTCYGGANQLWYFDYVASAQGFRLRNVNSGKCLEVKDSSRNGDAFVGQYDCHNGKNQLWDKSNVS